MTTQFPDPATLDIDAWTSTIHVEVAGKPLPVRMRIGGGRQHVAASVRGERPWLPSFPATVPVIRAIGVSALAILLVRERRRTG